MPRPSAAIPAPAEPPGSPGMNAGIAWANEPAGVGWTPIFGGSSAVPASPRRVSAASSSRASSAGIAAVTSAPVR